MIGPLSITFLLLQVLDLDSVELFHLTQILLFTPIRPMKILPTRISMLLAIRLLKGFLSHLKLANILGNAANERMGVVTHARDNCTHISLQEILHFSLSLNNHTHFPFAVIS